MKWFRSLTGRLDTTPRVKRVVIGVIGTTVLVIGVLLILTPGPASLIIPLGFAILASEFAWARRVIRRGKVFVGRIRRGNSVRVVEQDRPTP